MRALAVVGSLYGDEGKGLTVDALIKTIPLSESVIVVRSNGGPQAAHTVRLPDGRSHVFSHIGSGSFHGVRTHLSQFMLCNPMHFNRELDTLRFLNVDPRVSVSPSAMMIIPQDMMINQAIERQRGGSKHGSCGHGIGEAMHRWESIGKAVRVGDLETLQVRDLKEFQGEYLKARLEELELEYTDELRSLIENERILERYIYDCRKMFDDVAFVYDTELNRYSTLVFEAAQGLGLDQKFGIMPYCTRSNTGLRNIKDLCRQAERSYLDVYHVIRCYATRHGAGPLTEEGSLTNVEVDDPTNVPNEWQDQLRKAPLDIELVAGLIRSDLEEARHHVDVSSALVMTCLDQVRGPLPYMDGGTRKIASTGDELHRELASLLDSPRLFQSHGPTRDTFIDVARI
jgi:adenylosuccinate synthase